MPSCPRPLVALAVLCATGCGLLQLGSTSPLPPAGLPRGQTIEGGAQVQLSSAGLQQVTSAFGARLRTALAAPACLGPVSVAQSTACAAASGCASGCTWQRSTLTQTVSATSATQLNVLHQSSVSLSVPVTGPGPSCTLDLALRVDSDLDVRLVVDPASGVMSPALAQINAASVTPTSATGCEADANRAALLTAITDALTSEHTLTLATAVDTALQPLTANALEGAFDPGLLLLGAPTGRKLEARLVSGGFATLVGGGARAGSITGFNADVDDTTRDPARESEPHPCVGAFPAPDLSLAPWSLSSTSRGTRVFPSQDLSGAGSAELVVGVSELTLDLAGHHAVASGALCVDLLRPVLRRDVLDDLLGVPLGDADAPLTLQARPRSALDFTVRDGGVLDARLGTLRVAVSSADGGGLHADLDVTLALALATTRDDAGVAHLEALQSSLTSAASAPAVDDTRYAPVGAPLVGAVAASLADVLFATSGSAPPLPVPALGGVPLRVQQLDRLSTPAGEFFTLAASLSGLAVPSGPPAPAPTPTQVSLEASTPAAVRAALSAGTRAGLPSVHLTLPLVDGARSLEHAWRLAGGRWHPWQAGGALVLTDPSFAWQGRRTLELRSRVTGDDASASATTSLDVTVDYAPPTVFAAQVVVDATSIRVPARDAVSGTTLTRALGPSNATAPTTAWSSLAELSVADARALGAEVELFVRDEAGLMTSTHVTLPPIADAGVADGGAPDAGALDAGVADAGALDAGALADAGAPDAGVVDAGVMDAGVADGGLPASDAGAEVADAGTQPVTPATGCGCFSTDGGSWLGLMLGVAALLRRRAPLR